MSIEKYEYDANHPDDLQRLKTETENDYHSQVKIFSDEYQNSQLRCNHEEV